MNEKIWLVGRDGTDDVSGDVGWGGIPLEDRHAWARAMLDYCPAFPGAVMMNVIAAPILAGGTSAPGKWKRVARGLHDVGFRAVDYYALCQDLQIRRLQGRLTRAAHGDFFEDWNDGTPHWAPVPIAAKWRAWPEHLRAGRTPRRATDYVLSGGAPPPIGTIIRDTGAVEMVSGD